jgi:hypothetical protein
VQLESFRFRRVNVYLKNVMTTSTVRPNENNRLARIIHHASRFCPLGWRTHAVDPSVWIGVRQLAVQRIGD